jgi:hypothetical protein
MRDRRSRSHPDHEGIAMSSQAFRRDIITKPIFSWARGALPAMSDTEREALEAGDVWWDADLFTGNPDWSLAAAHEAVAKVIEVDDFAPEALSPIYKKPAGVHQFFQELGEQRAAS